MDHLRCVVQRITYANEQNGYTVLKCSAKGYQDLVTVVGTMPETHVGSVLTLGGFWKMDAKYGRQFSVQKFEETLPATVYGIEKYLGSGLIKGVGPKFAKRIVNQFGADTLSVIEETPELEATLDEMLRTKEVIKEDDAIYLQPFYFAETGCARLLKKLMAAERRIEIFPNRIIHRMQLQPLSESVPGTPDRNHCPCSGDAAKNLNLAAEPAVRYGGRPVHSGSNDGYLPSRQQMEFLYGRKIYYDEIQWQAIRTALSSKVMVLTGGPGTGKTTTTKGIITAFRATGCQILLAAPTGRAAKRMTEATGLESKTIHRLLEYKPPEGYQRNEENPLEGDVLIVDECSMIDILLMYNLLKALPSHMTLILVGDTDQLPSVGAGNVLKDIIASGAVPVVRLNRIFRQAQGSRIIMNAHRINRGENIDLRGGKDSDFFFKSCEGSLEEINNEAVDTIVRYCTKNLPAYYRVDPLEDIHVLTPMQRGVCGAANLNQVLQQAMNPNGVGLSRGGITYRVRDKVMQIRNDYDKEVFNGDIGTILGVDLEERELTVRFDDREITYDVSELDELTLAYATTIHKAQGSEYPIVVMPITMSHYVMLQRNLLYTGVTRAKRILVLVGEKKAISCAIHNETTSVRNTKLAERLAK